MISQLLRPKDWSAWVRLTIGFLIIGGLWVAVFILAGALGLSLHWPLGWLNLLVASCIIAWYIADSFVARRSFYQFFGETEDTIKHELRLWRRLILLASALSALGAALIVLANDGSSDLVPVAVAGPIAILIGAFLATVGWMYTRFEQEKSDRAGATLQAIREQLYGDHVSLVYQQMRAMSDHYRTAHGIPDAAPLPIESMETRIDALDDQTRPDGKGSTTLALVTDQFFNALNQLAFGVRQGQFDLHTIEMVLRPRFVRHTFVFFEYIKKVTKADEDPQYGRWRAKTRTWEHLLWLTSKLDVLNTDAVDYKCIVMPPDHIVGCRKAERLEPPKRDRTKPNIKSDQADSSLG